MTSTFSICCTALCLFKGYTFTGTED